MRHTTFQDLFRAFEGKRVLVAGDVMVDSYLWGRVDRISPEAPVPVVALHTRENRLGGAANVALNLSAMGAVPLLCSVIGNDQQGQVFLELMGKEGLDATYIHCSSQRPTTTKFRIIGNNSQILRVDEESLEELSITEEDKILNLLKESLEKERPDVLIFQDYNKGVLTASLIHRLIEMANAQGIPICADPKKKNFEAYRNITLFKPNLKELKEGLKLEFDDYNPLKLEAAAELLQQKQNIDIVLLTLSEHGVMVRHREENGDTGVDFIPAHKRSIADVSGAGDTVISLAALCLCEGCSPAEAAAIANLGGGLVCEERGVVPVNKEKLLREVIQLLTLQS